MPFKLRDVYLAFVALQSTFGFLYLNGLVGKLIDVHSEELSDSPPLQAYFAMRSHEDAETSPLPALKKSVALIERNKRTARTSRFTPVPDSARGTFWIDKTRVNKPVREGFEARGWRYVASHEKAHVVYTYLSNSSLWTTLEPYQRYNHIPGVSRWNHKDKFNEGMMKYKKSTGKQVWSVPATFQLNSLTERKNFRKVLFEQVGLSRPWVLKVPNLNRGKGITMLGPNTEALKNVLDTVENDKDNKYIIQEYVCNAMTIEGYKFEFRIHWLVASVDPLVVLWHPGYLRIIMNQKNDELMKNWNSTEAHLGNLHASGKAASWRTFAENLEATKKRSNSLKKQIDSLADSAMHHVENQVKHSLAQMVDAFKDVTFTNNGTASGKKFARTSSENIFGFYCADFIIDEDLDVFLIEPQYACGMMNKNQVSKSWKSWNDVNIHLTEGMAEIVDIVTKQQELGLPIDTEALNAAGSAYEVIYNDGWMFEYEGYERAAKKGCDI